MHSPERPIHALFLRIAAILAVSTMFAMVKLGGERGLALPEMMFWRQAISLPLILGWLASAGTLHKLKTQRLGSHAMRAGVGTMGMVSNFGAYLLLPLAEATTLGFTSPFFAVIISALVLRETVGHWRWLAVALGFIGVVIISQPGGEPIAPLGLLAGLSAGLFVAIISFQIRDLTRTEEPISIVFYFALFGTLGLAVLQPFYMTTHGAMDWLLLLSMGVVGTLGQFFLSASLRHGAVASVIVMDYTALIWATFFGWAIWDRLPPATTWLGAPAIIAAGILVAWREHKLSRAISPSSAIEAD